MQIALAAAAAAAGAAGMCGAVAGVAAAYASTSRNTVAAVCLGLTHERSGVCF